MKKNISGNNSDNSENKPENNAPNFTVKTNKDTQDAIIRNLYIPKILRDRIKKPDDERGR